ncbi:oxidoreductase [Helicobacter pylori]|uniref:oxidoreductase n=1 Tax=Helicobacter pylori TaxID=210 RepID=UPI001681BFFE|nr:oxidoreductase [Helicobacter pylori]
MIILIRDLIFILIPVIIIGLILAGIRSAVRGFRGMDDEDADSDGFFSRIWDKVLEWLGIISVFIGIFFPYIFGITLVLIAILS